ncbi:MAG: archaeosortase/exosortase family protein [Chitinophagales bacterium]|nr:archaeosortase/exosortase family protein [Chitinophagaceae bacterium]MCB9064676.1 archaeosortase/exosortase family protein [Chitinophagales bacterium]
MGKIVWCNKTAVRYVLLFFISYGLLYITNYILTGLLQPGGYYSEWLANNLDYVTVFRTFLLRSTSSVIEILGYETYLQGNVLYTKGGHSIRMVYSCIGINILCMWWAFVIALPMKLLRKLLHFIFGTVCLIGLNISRLSMLTMSPDDYSLGELVLDHHTIYNCLVYGVILITMKRVIDIAFTPR